MLMLCSIVKDPCSLSRTMQIIIHDDTYKDFMDGTTKKCHISYTLMVAPDDTIVAVKAYIQEQTRLSFKNQKLMNEVAVLRDRQTLVSLGIKKGSSLILRYAPISNDKFMSCVINVKVQHGVGDLKVILQEKTGFRFHKHILMYGGQILANEERLVHHDKLVLL
ncbi:hypothetical protein RDI58_027759 [Solanum bulbocastanum]|uniref:Ubiquitin-like domain-containing protein n=1 Tax=Solanum bulbocastanum TaxID=147425 RepID=A0AAN8Y4M6_SOLBU